MTLDLTVELGPRLLNGRTQSNVKEQQEMRALVASANRGEKRSESIALGHHFTKFGSQNTLFRTRRINLR